MSQGEWNRELSASENSTCAGEDLHRILVSAMLALKETGEWLIQSFSSWLSGHVQSISVGTVQLDHLLHSLK